MARLCPQCRERPATTRPAWFLQLPLSIVAFFGGRSSSERLCADCAAGYDFLGLLSLIAIVVIGLVLAIIVW